MRADLLHHLGIDAVGARWDSLHNRKQLGPQPIDPDHRILLICGGWPSLRDGLEIVEKNKSVAVSVADLGPHAQFPRS